MTDETFTALQYAGPASWHHLIAPTHTMNEQQREAFQTLETYTF
jgi:hypothetical protein